MTPLAVLYQAIADRIAANVAGVDVLQRENTIQFLRRKPARKTAIINWAGAESQTPQIIGQSHQGSAYIWVVEVFCPGVSDSAENDAMATANEIVDALCPAASVWAPAGDCGPMRWDRTEAVGETETGYVVAVTFRHMMWR